MAKKDDVKQEIEVKVETSNLVDVQMTAEELKEYASYAAKKKDEQELLEAAPLPKETQYYDVILIYEHNINGKKYGPGKTTIPEQHLGTVQHQENMQRQQEIRLNTTSNRMFQIMNSGQAVPVPVKG